MKKKLYAVFHDGTFDGDNAFYAPNGPEVPSADVTIAQIKKLHLEQERARMEKEAGNTEEDVQQSLKEIKTEDHPKVKGVWIIDERTKKAAEAIWDVIDPGNDSSTYACNRAAKAVVDAQAIKRIGKRPVYREGL